VYELVPNKPLDSHLHGELLKALGDQFCMDACSLNGLGLG
jgi:hypothetical protein